MYWKSNRIESRFKHLVCTACKSLFYVVYCFLGNWKYSWFVWIAFLRHQSIRAGIKHITHTHCVPSQNVSVYPTLVRLSKWNRHNTVITSNSYSHRSCLFWIHDRKFVDPCKVATKRRMFKYLDDVKSTEQWVGLASVTIISAKLLCSLCSDIGISCCRVRDMWRHSRAISYQGSL